MCEKELLSQKHFSFEKNTFLPIFSQIWDKSSQISAQNKCQFYLGRKVKRKKPFRAFFLSLVKSEKRAFPVYMTSIIAGNGQFEEKTEQSGKEGPFVLIVVIIWVWPIKYNNIFSFFLVALLA